MHQSPDALASQIDGFVTRVRDQTHVPGIAVGVSNLQQRIFVNAGMTEARGLEQMTQHARFRVGCITKLLLATVVLELAREARIDLEVPIGDYLAELRETLVGDSICVAHLLSHTSGYRGVSIHDADGRSFTWDRFVAYLRRAPLLFKPGSVFSYEHSEAVLLGQIVRNVTGQDSNSLIREMLLEPLGICVAECGVDSSGLTGAGHHDFDPSSGRFRPSTQVPAMSKFWNASFAQLSVSVADLLAFAEALATTSGSAAGPIGAATIDLLRRRVIALPAMIGGQFADLKPVAFGYGTAHLRDSFLGHNGFSRGQSVALRYDPETQLCIAVGLNAQVPHLRDYILSVLCRVLSGRAPSNTPRSLPFEVGELEGVYLGPGRSMVTAERDQDGLKLDVGIEGDSRKLRANLIVRKDGEPTVKCALPEFTLAFFREPHGNAMGLMVALNAYKRI